MVRATIFVDMVDIMTEQVVECQKPKLHYMAAHADARKRMKAGLQQAWCETCQRWKWQDQLCPLARTRPYIERS